LPTALCVEVVAVSDGAQTDVQAMWTAIGIVGMVLTGGVFVLVGRSVVGR
jgi:hypothetical protein